VERKWETHGALYPGMSVTTGRSAELRWLALSIFPPGMMMTAYAVKGL